MKRVLIFTHILPPAIDGGSQILYKIGKELETRGVEVDWLTSDCWSSDDFVERQDDPIDGRNRLKINWLLARVLRKLGRLLPVGLGRDWCLMMGKGPIFQKLRIPNKKYDWVVAGPLPTTIAWYARLVANKTGAKLALIPCFHENDKDFWRAPLISILKASDLVGSLTDYENKLLKKIGCQMVRTIGVGVDKKLIIENKKIKYPNKLKVLFLGNFAAHKRIELLMKACKKLGCDLTLAGRKTLYSQNLIFEPWVKVIDGGYDQKQLVKMLDSCSVLVLPSVHESFGIVLVEAWSRGKPVVATNLPTMSEIINKCGGGLVFKKDNLEDLIEKIKMANEKMGRLGLNEVKNCYTWDKVVNRLWPEEIWD